MVFFCAPGMWTMWRCKDCRSGYLDPRPTVETIGLAYASYYTHEAAPQKGRKSNSKPWRKASLRKGIRSAYRNRRHGHRAKPGLDWLNCLSVFLSAQTRLKFEYAARHLPAARHGARLLDIGCGNGGFLRLAAQLGYSATGMEIDPSAIQAARSQGFDVVEGKLPDSGLESGQYEQVTLSHVLEHLHDPAAALYEIFRLLKSGGRLWLQFPNIDAYGLEIYGPAWRGLEPPRHLVLPSQRAIKNMLAAAGFVEIRLLQPLNVVNNYFRRSDKIRSQLDLPAAQAASASDAERRQAREYERRHPERSEQLTLVAYKP
jgi:2-polyprenyl-3-methyl-5-hydroxy-6-metoxy-1,4-benzoquinol methylase